MLVVALEVTNVLEDHNASVTCTAIGYPVREVAWKNSDGSSFIKSRLQSGVPLISSTGIGNVSSISVELRVIGAI